MGESDFDRDLRRLYQEPLDGFIVARDAMVKELRTAGRDAEASVVKALRKPSVPAWALNQLASRNSQEIRTLLDAGVELRAAQQAALSSDRNADRLREATAGRRQVVTKLTALTADILLAAGRSPNTHLGDIRSTLETASVDPEAAERLCTGTLDRTIREPVGFGDVFGLRSVTGGASSSGAGDSGAGEKKNTSISKAELARLRRERDVAASRRSKAREVTDRLANHIAESESRLKDQRAKLSAAEAAALEAESEAQRAEKAVRDASR